MFETITSRLGTLKLNDFQKGAILVVIVAVLTVIKESLDSGTGINFNAVFNTSLTALIAYLLKNLGTNSKGEFMGKEK